MDFQIDIYPVILGIIAHTVLIINEVKRRRPGKVKCIRFVRERWMKFSMFAVGAFASCSLLPPDTPNMVIFMTAFAGNAMIDQVIGATKRKADSWT